MRIVAGSGGSFLAPPGHPMHFHHIEDGPTRNPNLIAGLDYALTNEYGDVSDALRTQVQALYDAATLVCSETYQAYVYGYFRHCYSPDGTDRNVSRSVTVHPGPDAPPATHHLAYLMVREYFPDHEPREDLIASGGNYGTSPCAKCGKTLQYEARVDTFAEAITAVLDCPKGGQHQV